MKTTLLALVALAAQVTLGVPHGGGHKRGHDKRIPQRVGNHWNMNGDWHTATATFTTVTTVTDPAAVVWVDQYNNIISTEYKAGPTHPPAPAPETPAPFDTPAAPSQPTALSSDRLAPAPAAAPPSASAPASSDQAQAPNADANVQQQADGQGPNTGSTGGAGGFGICYDLMSSTGSCRSAGQMNQELGFIKSQGFGTARSYDIGCDVGGFVTACGNNGMKCMIGLNLIDNIDNNLNTLIQKVNGNWGPVHTVNIGNEVVNNGGSADAVVQAINQARPKLQAAGFTGNVVTVDVFSQHVSHPALCGASDYCAANAHAIFDPNTSPPNAGSFVKNAQSQVASIAGGKKVVITESGWAKAGAADGAAVPGVVQQQQAIGSIKSAFGGDPDDIYIFQAYDATCKPAGPRGLEQHFGIF